MRQMWIPNILLLTSVISPAYASQCVLPPPACESYWIVPSILLATVTEILDAPDRARVHVRMRVDRTYKGQHRESITTTLFRGPFLSPGVVGSQILLYTTLPEDPAVDVKVNLCDRVLSVKEAAEDLEYLNNRSWTAPTGTLFGRVVGNEAFRLIDPAHNLAGVAVVLEGKEVTSTQITDSDGRYSFDLVPPGVYQVSAALPGYQPMESPSEAKNGTVEVRAGRCSAKHFYLKKRWPGSVEGQLIREDGSPGPQYVNISLTKLDDPQARDDAYFMSQAATSDENGRFSFPNLSPGPYILGLSLMSKPTPQWRFWPNESTKQSAGVIEVRDSAVHCDLPFNASLKLRRFSGKVRLANGNPASGAVVFARIVSGYSQTYYIDADTTTKADGSFSLIASEGVEFDFVAVTPVVDSNYLSSGTQRINLTSDLPEIVLTLDQSIHSEPEK